MLLELEKVSSYIKHIRCSSSSICSSLCFSSTVALAAVNLVGHLAVDALRAEEGGAAVLAAVAIGDAEAAPGPALEQAHGEAGEEARQEQVQAPRRAHPENTGQTLIA